MPESAAPIRQEMTDRAMWGICRIHELFREKDCEVPGQLVSVFCFVASHNPCHMQAIEQGLGLSSNSVSRNTDWLSDYHRLGKPGMGLIAKEKDPLNYRRRICRLTPKGEDLVRRIKEILCEG